MVSLVRALGDLIKENIEILNMQYDGVVVGAPGIGAELFCFLTPDLAFLIFQSTPESKFLWSRFWKYICAPEILLKTSIKCKQGITHCISYSSFINCLSLKGCKTSNKIFFVILI